MTTTLTASNTSMNNVTKQFQTPVKIQLPPLSSILHSPAESSLRHSLISSTPNTTFNSSFQKHNIFNPVSNITASTPLLLQNGDYTRTHSLPTLDSFHTSPTLKKSLSLPLPIFPSSHNNYPSHISKLHHASSLPSVPLFDQSHNTSTTNYNMSATSEANVNESFVHSTPFKKPVKLVISNEPIFQVKLNKKRKSIDDDSKSFAFISHSQETFLSNEPDIDNAALARRKRRRTSALELNILNDEFKLGPTPNKQRRILIAEKVDMTEKAVQIWFQNKRQAQRKQSKKLISSTALSTSSSTTSTVVSDDEILNSEILNESLDDDESDKENINPNITANTSMLPPKGKFSTSSPSSKEPLSDITNSMICQTFKFKSTNFDLVHPASSSRRQKPTMKLKMKVEKV